MTAKKKKAAPGVVGRKIRAECAAVVRPYQQAPCSGCSQKCGLPPKDRQVVMAIAREDYQSVYAWLPLWVHDMFAQEYIMNGQRVLTGADE